MILYEKHLQSGDGLRKGLAAAPLSFLPRRILSCLYHPEKKKRSEAKTSENGKVCGE